MPAARDAIQHACLRYFIGERRAQWLARALLGANRLWPRAGLLPEVDLADVPARRGAGPPLGDAAYVAFQVGTPGPFQKASALFLGAQGQGVALATPAMAPTGDAMVRSEPHWLATLAGRHSKNRAEIAETQAENPSPEKFHRASNLEAELVKANPQADPI